MKLGDRAFCSFAHLALLYRQGFHAVFRMHPGYQKWGSNGNFLGCTLTGEMPRRCAGRPHGARLHGQARSQRRSAQAAVFLRWTLCAEGQRWQTPLRIAGWRWEGPCPFCLCARRTFVVVLRVAISPLAPREGQRQEQSKARIRRGPAHVLGILWPLWSSGGLTMAGRRDRSKTYPCGDQTQTVRVPGNHVIPEYWAVLARPHSWRRGQTRCCRSGHPRLPRRGA